MHNLLLLLICLACFEANVGFPGYPPAGWIIMNFQGIKTMESQENSVEVPRETQDNPTG